MAGPFTHSPEEEAALNRVRDAKDDAEKRIHRGFREKAEHLYRLYRSYQATKSAWVSAGARDRDGLIYDAKREWGAELFIPYAFATVEVIVPRAVSHRPRMLVLPRDSESEGKVDVVRQALDAQQEAIDYELTLQDVLRTGMIYNLGVQKTLWRKEYAKRRLPKRASLPKQLLGRGAYVEGPLEEVSTFDGPDAEWVDPFDWFWDPFGHSIRTCRWAIHRTWRDHAYVLDRLRSRGDRPADWDTSAARQLTEDDVKGMGPVGSSHSMVWKERMEAAGHREFDGPGSEQLHEVWEFHDGERVLTVLDGQVLVRDIESPTLGQIPFQVYRPTRVPGEMIGIGEIEPIEHLQLELNTLRSQRRDNATLKLMQSYAYDRGVLDEDDVVFGPGSLIGVNGDPRAALFPLSVGDIPSSGYSEESAIINDIQRTTGVDDSVSGNAVAGGAAETATGVQLVQAAANMRIQNKARRLEVEVIRPACRVFFALNQRMALEEKEIRIPAEPEMGQPPEKQWEFLKVSPEDWRGDFDFVPEGGSTQPENTPQKRQDAQMKWNMFGGNAMVDQRLLLRDVLADLGIKNPETMVSPPDRLPPSILEKVVAAGFPQEVLQMLVEQAQAEDQVGGQQPAQQAPVPEQVPA